MREHLTSRSGRRGRRRGAALVIVMIFGVGALMLVSTLLSLTNSTVTSEYDRHRVKQMPMVVKAGIAAALNEINRDRLDGPYDPDNDGPGALVSDPAGTSGNQDGIPVTTPDGILLGRFRSHVETDYGGVSGRNVLVVVAVWPSFTAPAGWTNEEYLNRRRLACAEVEIQRGRPPFPANALSLTGPTSVGGGNQFEISGNPKIKMSDPSISVPAVNITDATTHADFQSDVIGSLNAGDLIQGADSDNPGVSGSNMDTVTNEEAGLLKETTLDQIANGIDARVTAALAGLGTTSTAITQAMVDAQSVLPNGTYVVNNDLDFKNETLTGSGTLIITEEIVLQSGGKIVWDGEVIVADDNDAEVEVQSGADIVVDGIFAILNRTDQNDTRVAVGPGGGTIDVTGAFVFLSDVSAASSGGNVGLSLNAGARIFVDGIFALMGEGINLNVDNGTELEVTGSTVITVPEGATQGLNQFRMKDKVTLTFDNPNFNSALDDLGEFFDPSGQLLPVSMPSYWERSTATVLSDQETKLATTGPWGMP